MMKKTGLLFLLFLSFSALAAEDYRITHVVEDNFEEVRENVVNAIINRGLVINNISRVGEMLERTGRGLGDTQRIFHRAEILEFCSAGISRENMKANPHIIVFCPYGIAIYVLPDNPRKVYISYRKPVSGDSPQERSAMQSLEKLMSSIVLEAIE